MALLKSGLSTERIAANLARVRQEIDSLATGCDRDPSDIEILAATKYISIEDMDKLAQAGITLVGENRAQDLDAKATRHGESFTWDFIGQLQSRKVRLILPHVRLIHSVASESALAEIERRLDCARPGLSILLEVNIANEQGKSGIAPEQLDAFMARSPVPVAGLMAMPPLTGVPENSRRWFRELRELAHAHDLKQLSMGTTQDYPVAVAEGATIVRIGTKLYA
ncbi:MAG TPA: YggS family pyridoxal phosphate-dependent enzyme [Solirubrobacteraceae bacterium]|jgi:hypothetical protein